MLGDSLLVIFGIFFIIHQHPISDSDGDSWIMECDGIMMMEMTLFVLWTSETQIMLLSPCHVSFNNKETFMDILTLQLYEHICCNSLSISFELSENSRHFLTISSFLTASDKQVHHSILRPTNHTFVTSAPLYVRFPQLWFAF